MDEGKFPNKVTKDTIPKLMEKAQRIRENSERLRYGFIIFVLVGFPYVVVGFGTFFLALWLGLHGYLNFLLEAVSPEIGAVPFFFILWIILLISLAIPTLIISNALVMRLLRKYLGFPTIEEVIFADCLIISKHLLDNERVKATKEVKHLLDGLRRYTRKTLNPLHSKRKVYTRELNILRSGKTEICRMLMFSKDNVSGLLMNFGLTFVRNDDPEAFSILKQIIEKVNEYGELKGRVHRLLSGIERYPHASPLVLTIIVIIIGILYFHLSGQRLPI